MITKIIYNNKFKYILFNSLFYVRFASSSYILKMCFETTKPDV